MPTNSVLTRAHALWEGLAGAPVSFSSAEPVDVAISPRAMICLEEVLGPATLAYLDEHDFRQEPTGSVSVDRLSAEHPDLRRLEVLTGEHESEESGLREITSPAFAVRIHDKVVTAAGYRMWPSRTAHMSVLTAPGNRG